MFQAEKNCCCCVKLSNRCLHESDAWLLKSFPITTFRLLISFQCDLKKRGKVVIWTILNEKTTPPGWVSKLCKSINRSFLLCYNFRVEMLHWPKKKRIAVKVVVWTFSNEKTPTGWASQLCKSITRSFKFFATSELKWCIGQRKMKNTIISTEPIFLALLQRASGSVADVSSHHPGPSSAAFVRTAEGLSSRRMTDAGLTSSAGSGFRKWGLPTRSSWSPSTASITYHRQGENFALLRLVGWSIQSLTIHQ